MLCMLLSLMLYVMHQTICYSWMIMAWLYGIFECKQHELYDMKYGKPHENTTPLGICMIRKEMKIWMTCKHETWQEVMFINVKCRTSGDLMHIVCSSIWGIPLSHHKGTDAYIQWQGNDHYALHSAAVTVSSFNRSQHKGFTEYAHRIREVAQQCAN